MSDLNNKKDLIFKSGLDLELLKSKNVFLGQKGLSPLVSMNNSGLSTIFKANDQSMQMLKSFNSTQSAFGKTGIGLLMKQMKEQSGFFQLRKSAGEMINLSKGFSVGIDIAKEKMISHISSVETLNSIKFATHIKHNVIDNIGLYTAQVELTKMLYTNPLFVYNNPTFDTSQYIGLNASNYLQEHKLSNTDFLTGATFSRISELAKTKEELIKSYDKIGLLLNDKDKLIEIVKLQKTILDKDVEIQELQSKKGAPESKITITTIETLFEWFANDILINKFGLTPQNASILMLMLYFPVITAKELFVEGEYGAIYHKIIGDEVKVPEASNSNNIYVNVYKQDDFVDFIVNKAKVFDDNNFKSNSLGYFISNTKVKILLIENGWCYLEGEGFKVKIESSKTGRRKKGKSIHSLKLRGWVEKRLLSKFK